MNTADETEAAEYAALGLPAPEPEPVTMPATWLDSADQYMRREPRLPVVPLLDGGTTLGPRFFIRRLPVSAYRPAGTPGNLPTAPPWHVIDRNRPAWMAAMWTHPGAIRVVDDLLRTEQTTRGDGLPWSE